MARKGPQDPTASNRSPGGARVVEPREDTARLSRRAFIKGAGAAAAVASLIGVPAAADTSPSPENGDAAGPGVLERLGPAAQAIELQVNGARRRVIRTSRDAA